MLFLCIMFYMPELPTPPAQESKVKPAQLPPEERVQAVIARSEDQAQRAATTEAVAVTSQADSLASKEKYSQDAEQNASELARLQAEQAQITGLGKIKDLVTGSKMDRDTQISMQEQRLKTNTQTAERMQDTYDQEVQIAAEAGKVKAHETTVTEANRRNLDSDNYAVPIQPSEQMRQALGKQAEMAVPLKKEAADQAETRAFYAEINYQAENEKFLMPPEMVREIKDQLEANDALRGGFSREKYYVQIGEIEEKLSKLAQAIEVPQPLDYAGGPMDYRDLQRWEGELRDWRRSKQYALEALAKYEKELNQRVGEVTACYEVALQLADELKVQLNPHLFVKAFAEGLQIYHKGSNEGWRRKGEFLGHQASASEVGYYEMGAAMLERFFNSRSNIKDRARVPYIVAYAAGAMEFGNALHLADWLRLWVAAAVDVTKTEKIYLDGEMQEQQSKGALGFDSFMDDYNKRLVFEGGNLKPGMAEGLTLGNDVAIRLIAATETHRYPQAKTRLMPYNREYTHSSVLAQDFAEKLQRSTQPPPPRERRPY